MTQTPTQREPFEGRYQKPKTNGIGLAGLILSIVGIVTCGLLSPIGLIVSIIGLLKAPRNLALAGTIISAIGTIVLVTVGYGMVMGFLGMKGFVEQEMNNVAFETSSQAIYSYYQQNDVLPDEIEAASLLPNPSEIAEQQGSNLGAEWLQQFNVKYEKVSPLEFRIVLAGKDTTFGTDDDVIKNYDITTMESWGGSTTPELPDMPETPETLPTLE